MNGNLQCLFEATTFSIFSCAMHEIVIWFLIMASMAVYLYWKLEPIMGTSSSKEDA
jgi:hypothetical protein